MSADSVDDLLYAEDILGGAGLIGDDYCRPTCGRLDALPGDDGCSDDCCGCPCHNTEVAP
jgi:hypothetical protein